MTTHTDTILQPQHNRGHLRDHLWSRFVFLIWNTEITLTDVTAVAGLELLPQVPPYVPRYASFLFSFLGRGVCTYTLRVLLVRCIMLTLNSLHLRWMFTPRKPLDQIRTRCHRRSHRCRILRSRVCTTN